MVDFYFEFLCFFPLAKEAKDKRHLLSLRNKNDNKANGFSNNYLLQSKKIFANGN